MGGRRGREGGICSIRWVRWLDTSVRRIFGYLDAVDLTGRGDMYDDTQG